MLNMSTKKKLDLAVIGMSLTMIGLGIVIFLVG